MRRGSALGGTAAGAMLLAAIAAGRPGAGRAVGAPAPVSAPAASEAQGKSVAAHLSLFRVFMPKGGAAPPSGWTEPTFDDHEWAGPAAAPFAPRPPVALPGMSLAGATLYEHAPGAPLCLRARFDVADPGQVRVLELRVAYSDGFIAWVNGREVARRGVGAGPPDAARAATPHGPEVERVYVAVPSEAVPRLGATDNVLAVAVYAFPGRSALAPVAPAAAVDIGAAAGVRIVRGPYLMAPGETRHGASVQVAWETDLPATGVVTVEGAGPGAGAGESPRRLTSRPPAYRQVVSLSGLGRGKRYRYRVDVDAGSSDVATAGPYPFETLPAPPRPLRFAVYGDMRYPGHAAHKTVVDGLVREAPALVLNTGDLTDLGSEESNWQRYFDITAPLGAITPVVPALGNHDGARAGAGAQRSWSLFGLASDAPRGTEPGWTSLDLGGVHFVVLNTNEMNNPAQKAWLVQDLAGARHRQSRAIFAFCHEGPWSHGLHGTSWVMIRDYAPILAAGHVDVLFSGHDHLYERGVGSTPAGKLTYVVTGGGGAPLYNPSCRARTGPPPGDVPGALPPCPTSVAVLTKTYHYIIVEVGEDAITLCPRHPDGSPVEPCVRLPRSGRG